MRAELTKDSHYVVFLSGDVFGVLTGDVMVYTYAGVRRLSAETYGIQSARDYWAVLVTKGYHVVIPVIRDPKPTKANRQW